MAELIQGNKIDQIIKMPLKKIIEDDFKKHEKDDLSSVIGSLSTKSTGTNQI